ncbi:MAG: hypothetical protein KBF82_09375 [Chitinophagaceae bacterium]|nr:hypothetical protein [Chitinophagaceae bacterium]MBP9104061.1 hypothetical protein [Chitinophagaceae bacterium]
MKAQLKTWIALSLFIFLVTTASAQQKRAASAVSSVGYWVVEGNVATPLNNIIRFYTIENELVYTETLNGVKLKLRKLKVRIELKEALEASVIAWQKNKAPQENKSYVSIRLKN